MAFRLSFAVALAVGVGACGDSTAPVAAAQPGVVFAYPADAQVDVPTGANVLVTLSDPVVPGSLACTMSGTTPSGGFCLVGPNGPVSATPTVSSDMLTVEYTGLAMEAGAGYAVYIGADLAPTAQNLPSGPLVHFTTRSTRPRAAAPTLIAVNGGDPANPESFRPMLEATTIELLFSEPLDARTVVLAPGAFELLDGTGADVKATILTDGIHVAIDPATDLTASAAYTVKVGAKVVDEGGQAMTPATITLTPHDSRAGSAPIPETMRTRVTGDPGTPTSRFGGTPNAMVVNAALIGSNSATFEPTTLAAELGDPGALSGPIAFTIRRGQRLETTGLAVKLGGQVAAGLSTGDIYIELLTDGGGRLFRNPHQAAAQVPENARAPLYVDFTLDVAVYSVDPAGNATLAQTVLGTQAVGVIDATEGVLDIETFASMDLGLLGVTSAPLNLDLELITDVTATPATDTTPPTLLATYPAQNESAQPIDSGVDLLFSEPVDIDRLRAGGLLLKTGTATIPTVIESHGASVVLRPTSYLARDTSYQVVLGDVADLAGNALAPTSPITFKTASLASTSNPMTAMAVHPGVPCALVGATASSPGQCSSPLSPDTDDLYHPFALAADQPLEAEFTQPPTPASIVLGTQCNAGSVRVEQVDGTGACTAAVPGTLLRRDRSIEFVPDVPWTVGGTYRFVLVSGGNSSCDAGELCGITGAASFDPLAGMDGTGASGGPNLVAPFTVTAPAGATYMLVDAAPFTDLNGDGQISSGEATNTDNVAAFEIAETGGAIVSATFDEPDCIPSTAADDDCMYLSGAMPVELQPVMTGCALPDGTSASACIPVAIAPASMYATSIGMTADTLFDTTTETSILRVREPANGPVTGYIFDANGAPELMVALDLYLDAPDMSIALSTHDLHSKPISLVLEGPVSFLPDGRIAIVVTNTADVPITINTSTFVAGAGTVDLVMPKGDMKLQLLSNALRGAPP